MTENLESEVVGENRSLTIYTFEDFLMLSNQGIFRDNVFILDPQRKWRKRWRMLFVLMATNILKE